MVSKRVFPGSMSRNKVDDTPFDVAQRFVDPRKMVEEQQALRPLNLRLNQGAVRVEEDRAV